MIAARIAPVGHGSRCGSVGRAAPRRALRPWLGGFNLLPYRQRDARLARRRCLREWIGAACAGGVAVLALAGWQTLQRLKLDGQRALLEASLSQLSAPLAEHARLVRTRDEQRLGAARAARLSEPLTHLRDLLDALSFEPGDSVLLKQLRQREGETELLATSRGHAASADWLKRLSAIRGVSRAEVSDLRRADTRGVGANAVVADPAAPVEFSARLHWGEPARDAARASGASALPMLGPAKQTSGGKK